MGWVTLRNPFRCSGGGHRDAGVVCAKERVAQATDRQAVAPTPLSRAGAWEAETGRILRRNPGVAARSTALGLDSQPPCRREAGLR